MGYNDDSESIHFLDYHQMYSEDINRTINIFENHNKIEEH